MDEQEKGLVERARATAQELRNAARDLEVAAVRNDYSVISELLDEFEVIPGEESAA